MRVLILLGEYFLPQASGGSQTTALQVAERLAQRGHTVAIAARLKRKSAVGITASARMVTRRRSFDESVYGGQTVFRFPRSGDSIGGVLAAYRPDVVLVHAMEALDLAASVNAHGLPLVVYWHDVEIDRLRRSPVELNARYIANSQFTASFYQTRFGIESTVVPPLVIRNRYEGKAQAGDSILFFGPVPDKGRDLAIAIATLCPEIPFRFVESWAMSRAEKHSLLHRVRHLSNVTFIPRQTDVAPLYSQARIVLVPSQWQEAWGRVASEAHINGKPVVASRVGGLPEATGPGGILVDPSAPATDWAIQLQRLWGDRALYERTSSAARAYSLRSEMDPEWAIGRIEATLASAIADAAPVSEVRCLVPVIGGSGLR